MGLNLRLAVMSLKCPSSDLSKGVFQSVSDLRPAQCPALVMAFHLLIQQTGVWREKSLKNAVRKADLRSSGSRPNFALSICGKNERMLRSRNRPVSLKRRTACWRRCMSRPGHCKQGSSCPLSRRKILSDLANHFLAPVQKAIVYRPDTARLSG